jgi:hypothetical protein
MDTDRPDSKRRGLATTDEGVRMKLNTGWIKLRWQCRHCDHKWGAGDRHGHQACMQVGCGVWRWWPVLR